MQGLRARTHTRRRREEVGHGIYVPGTSVEVMEIFQRLNEKGITIIMVTHEADIATYARRNVVMKDGLVQKDTAVHDRLNAAAELERISTTDALAQPEAAIP